MCTINLRTPSQEKRKDDKKLRLEMLNWEETEGNITSTKEMSLKSTLV